MSDALSTLETIYFTLQSNLDDMLAACQTQDDRDSVMTQYVAARASYWKCINHAFHDDDPALIALVAQAKVNIAQFDKIDESLGDIAKVLNIITETVTVASQIASKVIAV
jgi:hypothetical protein